LQIRAIAGLWLWFAPGPAALAFARHKPSAGGFESGLSLCSASQIKALRIRGDLFSVALKSAQRENFAVKLSASAHTHVQVGLLKADIQRVKPPKVWAGKART
jgi:hypothetical protein